MTNSENSFVRKFLNHNFIYLPRYIHFLLASIFYHVLDNSNNKSQKSRFPIFSFVRTAHHLDRLCNIDKMSGLNSFYLILKFFNLDQQLCESDSLCIDK